MRFIVVRQRWFNIRFSSVVFYLISRSKKKKMIMFINLKTGLIKFNINS